MLTCGYSGIGRLFFGKDVANCKREYGYDYEVYLNLQGNAAQAYID